MSTPIEFIQRERIKLFEQERKLLTQKNSNIALAICKEKQSYIAMIQNRFIDNYWDE